MAISNDKITMKGNPVEISGTALKVGDALPLFTLTGVDLQDLKAESLKGKPLVVSVIPSIDTPVCETQTRKFNEAMSKLADKLTLLTVSRDLPFAFKRWCATEGIDAILCASDYKYRSFGKAFGVDIENLGLLARAVFAFDKEGVLKHVEYVSEVTNEPDYDAVLKSI